MRWLYAILIILGLLTFAYMAYSDYECKKSGGIFVRTFIGYDCIHAS